LILKLKQTPGLYLIGFMGSGKTTIGRLLADRLGWNFVDVDDDIEAGAGRSIPEIFDSVGEPAFRAMEAAAIAKRVRAVACGMPTVMSVGGGAAAQPGNLELLDNNGVTIWLYTPFDTVVERIGQDPGRPLTRDMKRFEELFHERHAIYERAQFRIENLGADPAEAVDAILNLPLFR
jgi:shikimate kinase